MYFPIAALEDFVVHQSLTIFRMESFRVSDLHNHLKGLKKAQPLTSFLIQEVKVAHMPWHTCKGQRTTLWS